MGLPFVIETGETKKEYQFGPDFRVHSSFIQRTYDQLSQDLCINNNAASIIVFGGTITGLNDVTHLGFYDITLLCNIPNMVYLAPTCKAEYDAMLRWSIHQTEHPVAIRVPNVPLEAANDTVTEESYGDLNRYQITHKGSEIAILGLGGYYALAQKVAKYKGKRH